MDWFIYTFMASLEERYERLGRPFKLSKKQGDVCTKYMDHHNGSKWGYLQLNDSEYVVAEVYHATKGNSRLQNLNGQWFCKLEDIDKGLFRKL